MYLEMKEVSKKIDQEVILNHINLSMERGRIYGLKGKNGCGKTMIMRAVCGLMKVSGEIIISGERLGDKYDFPPSVGALIENPGFINSFTGYKNLKILADIRGNVGKERIEQVLNEVGLLPNDKKKYKKYSLGMKQKLGIAAALMENPDLIVLDEPTNALDEQSLKNLRELLLEHKKRGALIILSSHDAQELEFLSDEIYVVQQGEIKEHYVVKSGIDEKGE